MDDSGIATTFISQAGGFGTIVNGVFTQAVFDLGDFYKYDNTTGTWAIVDNDKVRAAVMDEIDRLNILNATQLSRIESSAYRVDGVLRNTRSKLWTITPNFFKNAPKGLAFQNGFLKLNDQNIVELHNHAPTHGARFVAPYNYTEQDTPKWDSILEAVFANDPDKDQKIQLLHEFIGAALLGVAPRLSRCMIFLGEGSNGKSTIQAIIRTLFPNELVCTSNPQTWHREYDRAELSGKRINITGELPEKEMLESEAFKSIVDGSAITARVIRQAPFQFCPEAAHLFSSNSMLKTNDYSHGFFRRFIMLPFANEFSPTSDDIVSPIIQNERGGIAFKAIKALETALSNKNYTLPSSAVETLEEWKKQANPVASFVESCIIIDDTSLVKASDLWVAWKNWAENYKFHPLNLTTFGRRITQATKAKKIRRESGIFYAIRFTDEGLKALNLFPRIE